MKQTHQKITRVGILGAAGYIGAELIHYILDHHPFCKITYLESTSSVNEKVLKIHEDLRGIIEADRVFQKFSAEEIKKNCDIIIMPKPCMVASKFVSKLEGTGVKIIDMSGDFRLKNVDSYTKWYGGKHSAPHLIENAVYGLPEINFQKIKHASLVANPGCYPTSIILALAPALWKNLIKPEQIFIDSYSGISGAGNRYKPNRGNLYIQASDNITLYGLGTHPHIPEIEQELSNLANDNVLISFIPHLAPFDKGIMSTIHVKPINDIDWDCVLDLYLDYYKDKPFVRVFGKNEYPNVKNVVGTNFCDIGIWVDDRTKTMTIISTIDNTIKGAVGQAIQNMNIMCDYDEVEGLPYSKVLKDKYSSHKHLSLVHTA